MNIIKTVSEIINSDEVFLSKMDVQFRDLAMIMKYLGADIYNMLLY
ncbi:hypothetical protein [Clostridium sp.]